MNTPAVGQMAPSFRLPSGQGPVTGPEDYRGRGNVIVWFTKGMACPFCRQQMSQLARGYPQFRALNTELFEVTATTPARAQFYVKQFQIPFPYLCDPDYSVRRSWGLSVHSHSIAWYAKTFYQGATMPKPPSDFGKVQPSLAEFPKLLADEDMGFFILDRSGVIRYALAGSYAGGEGVREVPSNDEIVRELQRCEGRSAG